MSITLGTECGPEQVGMLHLSAGGLPGLGRESRRGIVLDKTRPSCRTHFGMHGSQDMSGLDSCTTGLHESQGLRLDRVRLQHSSVRVGTGVDQTRPGFSIEWQKQDWG